MIKTIWRCFSRSLLLALWLIAFPVQAQMRVPLTFGDIEITMQNPPQGSSSHGYCEYVFRLRNLSGERPHTVSLSIPFERHFNRGDTLRELRRSVQVGAKETVRLALLQPDYPPIDGSNVAVFIDGRKSEIDLPLRPHESSSRPRTRGFYYYSRSSIPEAPLLLIGSGVAPLPTLSAMLGGPALPMGGGGMMGGAAGSAMLPPGAAPAAVAEGATILSGMDFVPCLGSVSEKLFAWEIGDFETAPGKPGFPPHSHQPVNHESVGTWSSNWLAYSRYDGVVITADELKTMPAGVRTALWQYVETGGFLFVLGPADLRGLSAVTLNTTDSAGWKIIHAGFGQCVVSPDVSYKKWDQEHFNRLSQTWSAVAAAWAAGDRRNTVDANHEFPVVEDLGIPVRGLLLLMFLFTLGIGPINLLILSRLKRRIWLLWTTPVFSLVTCVAVFGFMLFSEGWQGRLRTETLTLLDETTHRATTIGWTGVYTPLTPSDGLRFEYETEVIPQRFFEGERGTARFCTLDWSQKQHFAAGWVEARVPAHFKVRKSKLHYEQIILEHEADGSWSMVNGLSAAIRRFWYADDKGQMHTAEDIAAGARARLVLTEKESQPGSMNGWNLSSVVSWMAQMKEVATKPERFLRPGNYLAEVDESPFLENALTNAKKRKAHALIVGFR